MHTTFGCKDQARILCLADQLASTHAQNWITRLQDSNDEYRKLFQSVLAKSQEQWLGVGQIAESESQPDVHAFVDQQQCATQTISQLLSQLTSVLQERAQCSRTFLTAIDQSLRTVYTEHVRAVAQRRRALWRKRPRAQECTGCASSIHEGVQLRRICTTCSGHACRCTCQPWCADCFVANMAHASNNGEKSSLACPTCRAEYCVHDVLIG